MIIGDSLNSGIYSYAEDIFEALKCIKCGKDRINAVRNEFKIEKGRGKAMVDYLISGRIVEEESQLMEKLILKKESEKSGIRRRKFFNTEQDFTGKLH